MIDDVIRWLKSNSGASTGHKSLDLCSMATMDFSRPDHLTGPVNVRSDGHHSFVVGQMIFIHTTAALKPWWGQPTLVPRGAPPAPPPAGDDDSDSNPGGGGGPSFPGNDDGGDDRAHACSNCNGKKVYRLPKSRLRQIKRMARQARIDRARARARAQRSQNASSSRSSNELQLLPLEDRDGHGDDGFEESESEEILDDGPGTDAEKKI